MKLLAAEDGDAAIDAPIDAPTFDPALPLEVIFIDEAVEDSEVLLSDLRAGSDATQWLVITLSSDRDGIGTRSPKRFVNYRALMRFTLSATVMAKV